MVLGILDNVDCHDNPECYKTSILSWFLPVKGLNIQHFSLVHADIHRGIWNITENAMLSLL